ncbi:arsenate reductase ArsC [Nocardia yamanashiensis]|uniref:arsenate reductase ArsC n=1 Tax=Nocardia yamanashiensis TaxID=209247 RepID=UPI000832016E|nr:arsenate reductase ArsC [Nocardia yamanashiensis]
MLPEELPDDDQRSELPAAAARLGTEFAAVFDTATIDRILESSYDQLGSVTTLSGERPALAERFARERLIAAAKAEGKPIQTGPAVLFVCTHNAGRSQMAQGFFNHLVGDSAFGWSGGSSPNVLVNPLVVTAMAERGIDITAEFPKPWTDEFVRAADVVVDMGCGDTDPLVSGHRFEQWPLPDPAGQTMEEIRAIRDEIEIRVHRLAINLGLVSTPALDA